MFLGAPGSGKGTQSELICERFSIPHISTGDILRAELKAKSELGLMAQSFIDQGALVPDDVIMGIVRKRLEQDDCVNGCLFDGFPRTIAQAEALDAFLQLTAVIAIDVPAEKLTRRISGRRVCKSCGFTTHVDAVGDNTVCPKCGGELYQRSDDAEATVQHRLAVYDSQTLPLAGFYQARGILHHVDGDRAVEDVLTDIVRILEADAQ